jgi:hypothetical protein
MLCWKEKCGPAAHIMICDVVWESMDMAGESSVLYEQHELDPREVHWFPFVFHPPPPPGPLFAGISSPFGSKDICFWSIYLRSGHFHEPQGVHGVFFSTYYYCLGFCPCLSPNLHLSAIILWFHDALLRYHLLFIVASLHC